MNTKKIFCTFTYPENLDEIIEKIINSYTILYDKIFVLSSIETDELICTYNVDTANLNKDVILPNTIIAHRNKDYNVIYTVNALNMVNGDSDKYKEIDWSKYTKSILLTRKNVLTVLPTEIYSVVDLKID